MIATPPALHTHLSRVPPSQRADPVHPYCNYFSQGGRRNLVPPSLRVGPAHANWTNFPFGRAGNGVA
eukprot:scaffold9306_cov73-Cylindrotheca_fusiformis.AAC.1